MNPQEFIREEKGMHRTILRHPDFENIKDKFNQFAIVSQHCPKPTSAYDVIVQSVSGVSGYRMSLWPKCGNGERLYGLNFDGTLTLLIEDLDSSG